LWRSLAYHSLYSSMRDCFYLVFYTCSRRYLGNVCGTTDHNCHNIPLFVSKCKLCCRIHRGI
jgi:hypothetical protein